MLEVVELFTQSCHILWFSKVILGSISLFLDHFGELDLSHHIDSLLLFAFDFFEALLLLVGPVYLLLHGFNPFGSLSSVSLDHIKIRRKEPGQFEINNQMK